MHDDHKYTHRSGKVFLKSNMLNKRDNFHIYALVTHLNHFIANSFSFKFYKKKSSFGIIMSYVLYNIIWNISLVMKESFFTTLVIFTVIFFIIICCSRPFFQSYSQLYVLSVERACNSKQLIFT